MKDEVFIKTVELIEKVLKKKNLKLNPQTTAADVEGWDSLRHVMIIAEVEKTFNVKIDFLDLLNMENLQDICDIVKRNQHN